MKHSILLVEDELDLGDIVREYLVFKGFEVDWCVDGRQALENIESAARRYEIMLIDVSLSGMDGFELVERITSSGSDVPFLFLTARNEKQDRLHGLNLGADDYVVKPFDIDELVLRVRNIIRRRQSGTQRPVTGKLIQLHDVSFDRSLNKLIIKDLATDLTTREAELLLFLFRNPNRIIKREEILGELWGETDFFTGRSLDVFVSKLRKHLGRSERVSIKNVYGIGFIFSC